MPRGICYTFSMSAATRVVVVGAGAAGMMAAGVAAARGAHVTLLERNLETGRKLRLSGKGRCNITNDTDIDGLLANVPGNPRFLRPAFYAFTPQAAMGFFTDHGVPVKTERGGRVFPVSDDADDVAEALQRFCLDGGVTLHNGIRVQRLLVNDGRVRGVAAENGATFPADAVILATGGASYPGTGSTGDGYRLATDAGHTILPLRPSLVGLETMEAWPAEAQGLSLRNVTLTACAPHGKKLYQELGEMLLTHLGVSGPLVLTASRFVGDQPGSLLRIDLKPGLSEEDLTARILRDFEKYHRREIINALGDLLPRTLIPVMIRLADIPPHTWVHEVTRAQRQRLVGLLKALTLTVKKARPLAEAIVTVGGVNTHEIDPHTLQSRLLPGLFFTGEMIDVDGYTGGFNLQIAWSTGHLAGHVGA